MERYPDYLVTTKVGGFIDGHVWLRVTMESSDDKATTRVKLRPEHARELAKQLCDAAETAENTPEAWEDDMEQEYKLISRPFKSTEDAVAEVLITSGDEGRIVVLSARQAIQHGQRLLDLGLKALLKEAS